MAPNPIFGMNVIGRATFQVTTFDVPSVQSGCTERSTHTCARVPADLAQAPDGGGKVGGGSGEGFYGVLHKET